MRLGRAARASVAARYPTQASGDLNPELYVLSNAGLW